MNLPSIAEIHFCLQLYNFFHVLIELILPSIYLASLGILAYLGFWDCPVGLLLPYYYTFLSISTQYILCLRYLQSKAIQYLPEHQDNLMSHSCVYGKAAMCNRYTYLGYHIVDMVVMTFILDQWSLWFVGIVESAWHLWQGIITDTKMDMIQRDPNDINYNIKVGTTFKPKILFCILNNYYKVCHLSKLTLRRQCIVMASVAGPDFWLMGYPRWQGGFPK